MKLRATTTVPRRLRRGILVVISFVLLAAGVTSVNLFVNKPTYADRYDDQINALQSQINAYNAQSAQLAQQAQTYQNAIAAYDNQIASLQAQINLSQAKYDQLVSKIADTERRIQSNKDALGQVLADLYVNSQITPIEMLASSKNISDYLDQQTYRSSMQDQLTSTINQIQTLQTQLQSQKDETQKVLDVQNSQKTQLNNQRAQQQQLVDETQGQEAKYQQLVANAQAQQAAASAAQRAYYQSILSRGGGGSGVVGSFQYKNWSGNMGCSGGYPYCGSQDSYNDPWQLLNRECVSYVAWAMSARFGKNVPAFSGHGNAYQWAPNSDGGVWSMGSAIYLGNATIVTDPQPGDAVILPVDGSFAPLGHAMVVERAADSDGWIHVSQYNFYGTGEYSTMDIKASGVYFLRFP